jgi:hypothetical protein
MIKHLFVAMLALALIGFGRVPATRAETADSILANKKQRNAPVLPPTSSVPAHKFKWWAQKDRKANHGS